MLNFKALGIEDSELFLKYTTKYLFNTYDYSYTTLYQWRKLCNTEFCMIDDVLVIKKYTEETGVFFLQPMSLDTKDTDSIIEKLYEYKKNNPDFKHFFGDVDSGFLDQLCRRYGNNVAYMEDSGNFDYIYALADLINLSGKKYHRKKNLYNQFLSQYEYKLKDIREEAVRRDCIEFARLWYENNQSEDGLLKYELDGIEDVLNNFAYLNILGLAVYVDDQIAGFAFGEKLNEKMAVVHCEKGDTNYSGIYSFINKVLAQTYFSDVSFINRQEDMGIEGLRRAKTAYHPVKLEKKYFIDILEI